LLIIAKGGKMTKPKQEEVLRVIKNALDLKDGRLTIDSAVGDLPEWDSLGHLGILSALDKFFEGNVAPIKDMAMADSVRKILKILKENSLV